MPTKKNRAPRRVHSRPLMSALLRNLCKVEGVHSRWTFDHCIVEHTSITTSSNSSMFKVSRVAPASALAISNDPAVEFRHPAEDDMELDEDEYGAGPSTRTVVTPGESITSSKEYMRSVFPTFQCCPLTINSGHGTYVEVDQVMAAVAGTIERVNKLISVRPLNARYVPEVGDLVIGRIVEVGNMRWKVDANARQDAVLMLSSVNLPGGVQRRKIESDALKMREFLAEGDVSDLHTRAHSPILLLAFSLQLGPLPPHRIRSSWTPSMRNSDSRSYSSPRYRHSSRTARCPYIPEVSDTGSFATASFFHSHLD